MSLSAEERHRMIAEAAYYLAEIRNFAPGDALRDWFEAEAEIDRRLSEQEKRNFQERLEDRLKEWDARLAALKAKAKEAQDGLDMDYRTHVETLAKKREAVQSKMQALILHGGEAWEDLKEGTEKAWEELRAALDHVVSRFK